MLKKQSDGNMSKICVIVGASHAAAQLALSVRRLGWDGRIVVVSDEACLPYHRPPLSKAYFTGEKELNEILIRPQTAYEKAEVDLKLGVRVQSIDRKSKIVRLENGEELHYDKLALTVGARPREIFLPGSDKEGIFYLRNLNDADRIRGYVGQGKHAVIIGGGYIGLETAASLRKAGMSVTILEAMPRVLARVTTEEISAFYQRIHSEEGVNVITGASVESIQGGTSVEAVVCRDGQSFQADLVIVGIGVIPNIELAEDAGLKVNNGIVVDEYARSSDHDIVAAGDCTWHYNPIYQNHIRLESVQNANEQANVAAATICGELKPYRALPWFWSDQYDLKLQIAGLSQGFDQVIIRGDVAVGRSFVAFYLLGGRLLAVDAVNKPQEFMLGKQIISNAYELDTSGLADENIPLKELIKK